MAGSTAIGILDAKFWWAHPFSCVKILFKNILTAAADFLVPKRCVVCHREGDFFCAHCRQDLVYLEAPVCPVCTRAAIDGFTHPRCRRRFTLDRVFIPFRYRGPLSAAIKKLKYKKVTALSDFLVGLMRETMEEQGVTVGKHALILPVPLHPVKEWERGFNQAALLAESLGKTLGLKVAAGVVKRTKETVSQTRLKVKEREKNVRGAFVVDKTKAAVIKGKDLILIDDVFTTGATLRECGRILKRAGARFIYAFALAKD